MSTRDEGGPAFPHEKDGFGIEGRHKGMSLRDWFAGQALAGIMTGDSSSSHPKSVAMDAYNIADAMLAERRKP